MTPEEKKMRAERDKLRMATKMSIVNTIEAAEEHFDIKIGEHDTHVLIANILFEMFANLCTQYDLDLDKSIKQTLGESGADMLMDYVASSKTQDVIGELLGALLSGKQSKSKKKTLKLSDKDLEDFINNILSSDNKKNLDDNNQKPDQDNGQD